MILIIAALAACRGEPVPRDYQNAPPAVTHPPDKKSESPSQHGMGDAPPEPSKGPEGKTLEPVTPPSDTGTTSTSLPDTPPVTTTT